MIHVTSLQLMFKGSDVTMGSKRIHENMHFDSFTQDEYLQAVARLTGDDWKVFAISSVSSKASSAVDSLMQRFKGTATAVSRYVLMSAFDHVESELVSSVQVAAENAENPILKAWAFELEQLHIIKTVFRDNSHDPSQMKQLKSRDNFCFQPAKRCEATYDGEVLCVKEGAELKNRAII